MAIKDLLNSILELLQSGLINLLRLETIKGTLSVLKLEADAVLSAKDKYKNLAETARKARGLQAMLILKYKSLLTLLEGYKQQLLTLNKYKDAAVQLKKQYNDKIKSFFLLKTSNKQMKEYSKYKLLSLQFDFESDDLLVYDNNRKQYLLLELAGTFGNSTALPKSINKPKTTTPKLNNNTETWRDRIFNKK